VQLVNAPVGVPIPVSGVEQSTDPLATPKVDGSAGSDGLEQVLARVQLVQNVLPAGSTWDGKTDLPMTDAEFNKLMSGTNQGASDSASSGGEHAAPAAATPAAATGPTRN